MVTALNLSDQDSMAASESKKDDKGRMVREKTMTSDRTTSAGEELDSRYRAPAQKARMRRDRNNWYTTKEFARDHCKGLEAAGCDSDTAQSQVGLIDNSRRQRSIANNWPSDKLGYKSDDQGVPI